MTVLRVVGLLLFAGFALHAAPTKIYEVVLKDAPGGERILELAFYSKPPPPTVVDKILRESLEHAIVVDASRDILAMAFLGEDVLTSTQYSGELVYRASQKKIMTLDESRGVKTTVTDAVGYSLEVSEEKTLAGIKPERRWLTLSFVYSTQPLLEEAYGAMLSEIEKRVRDGLDMNAFVKVGDKNVKTSQEQMKDLTGGFVFMRFNAASKKIYRKNDLLKTVH